MPKNTRITCILAMSLVLTFTTPIPQAYADWNLFGGASRKDLKDFYAADELFKAGYYERSLARVDAFLKDNPDDIGGRMLKAWALLKLDRLNEGKTLIDGVLKEDPEHLDALVATGVYHRILGENDKALAQYEKVLSIDPKDPYALSSVVTVALLNCEVKKAVDYGERAVEGAPDDAVINANLAVAYHYDGQADKRDYFTKKAKELNYPSIDALTEIYSGDLLILPDDCDPQTKEK